MKDSFFFYASKNNLEVLFCQHDKNFYIIKNCDEKKGSELCKTFNASGVSCGKNMSDFMIGNFGKY